ncbi:unnamed protein product, partial [Larinioides sclopetarius]
TGLLKFSSKSFLTLQVSLSKNTEHFFASSRRVNQQKLNTSIAI